MSRSTSEILEQLQRFLPRRFRAYSAVLGGIAAQLAAGEAVVASLIEATTVDGGESAWLTLLARGYGLTRGPDETDADLRARLRSPETLVTRPGILALVNAILDAAGASGATMIEPFDDGFLDVDGWCDITRICEEHNSFVLVCPLVGERVGGASYLDHDYLGDSVFGGMSGEEDPIYAAIRAVVLRAKAAGIRATLAIDV